MEILLIFASLFALSAFGRDRQRKQDERNKEDWRRNNCFKGEHFVGREDGVCDVCGERAIIKQDKMGNIVSWKWRSK